jgi:hypothetical protein
VTSRPGRAHRARTAASTLARKAGTKGRRVAGTVRAAGKAVKAGIAAARATAPDPERARMARIRAAEPPVEPVPPEIASPPELSDEERIESAKYMPSARPRLFEEERFVFPESYGVNRVRLLVKDPEWLFAYWGACGRWPTCDRTWATAPPRCRASPSASSTSWPATSR